MKSNQRLQPEHSNTPCQSLPELLQQQKIPLLSLQRALVESPCKNQTWKWNNTRKRFKEMKAETEELQCRTDIEKNVDKGGEKAS